MADNNLELAHINQFIKLTGYPVSAKVCPEPDPDFRIELEEKFIGIEHTRSFLPKDSKGDDLTKHRTTGNRIVANAERMFKETHKEKLTVYVNFFCPYGLSIPSNMLTGKDEMYCLRSCLISPRITFLATIARQSLKTSTWKQASSNFKIRLPIYQNLFIIS